MPVSTRSAPVDRARARAVCLSTITVMLGLIALALSAPRSGAAAPVGQGATPAPSPTFAPYEPAGVWAGVHGPGIDALWGPIGAPTLNGIHVLQSEGGGLDGWAVGDNCALARFDGADWTRVEDLESLCGGLTRYDFRDVFMRAEDDVWAVGRVIGGSGAFARDCVAADIRNIERDEGCGFVTHFDGERWRLLIPGDYGIIRIPPPLNAIDMRVDDASGEWQGWVVGNNADYDSIKAIILEYDHDGRRWSVTRATNNLVEHLRDVKILSATDAWIAGDSGTESRFQISPGDDRGQWRRLGLSGRDHLYAIDLTERDYGWDGGWRGRMNRYDGSCDDDDASTPCWFDNQAYPIRNAAGHQLTTIDVLAIDLLDLGIGWLVGLSNGRVSTVAYLSIEKWWVAPVERDPGRDLHGLFMLSESRGWAVGAEGTILQYHVDGAIPSSTPTIVASDTSTASPSPSGTSDLSPTAIGSPSATDGTPPPTEPWELTPTATATEMPPTETPVETPTDLPIEPTPTTIPSPPTDPPPSATSRPPGKIYLPWTALRRSPRL